MASKQQSGGSKPSDGSERGGSGIFANDPQQASEEGKKISRQLSQPDSDKSQRGGSGNFADDHEKASEAGRKGGQHSHGDSSK